MGFIKACCELEDYLNEHNGSWALLTDSEYKILMKKWRGAFEQYLIDGYREIYGDAAIISLESRLGVDAYIFNAPNYKHLSLSSSSHDPTYAYHVTRLDTIDRDVFDKMEAIVCDQKMSFMCAFNHEGQSLVPKVFCEVE